MDMLIDFILIMAVPVVGFWLYVWLHSHASELGHNGDLVWVGLCLLFVAMALAYVIGVNPELQVG